MLQLAIAVENPGIGNDNKEFFIDKGFTTININHIAVYGKAYVSEDHYTFVEMSGGWQFYAKISEDELKTLIDKYYENL